VVSSHVIQSHALVVNTYYETFRFCEIIKRLCMLPSEEGLSGLLDPLCSVCCSVQHNNDFAVVLLFKLYNLS
jgi:hypothetical protein